MKSNKLTIQINKPAAVVFEAATNPANTPKWIDSIAEEKISEWPIKLGTIYQNRGDEGEWAEMVVSEFEKDGLFTLSDKQNNLLVRYIFKSISDNITELEYSESVREGELGSLMPQSALQKLKQLIESA